MTPEQLKNSILQLAIQGKLVKQRKEEGTGEELYKEIQEEKKKLIEEGKLKKQKSLPEITEDKIPFDIPETWKWVRLGEISKSVQYGYNAPAKIKGRIKMVRISDIQDDSVCWDMVPYCDIHEDEIEQYLLKNNDILFARTGGTVGKSFLVKNISENAIFAGYLIRTRYGENIAPQFLKCFMGSALYWEQLHNGTIATAQPNCNGKTLSNMILPLPSLAEQKRIVEKIEELLPLVDRYEKAWTRLEELNKKFPLDMQKSILQEAIQGKLVKQRKEEGTGEELFKEIQEEKQKLIAEGKLKKQKNLPEITEGEIPFDIPETWKWVRLGDSLDVRDGTHDTPKYVLKGYPLVTSKNLKNGIIDFDNCKYISEIDHLKISERSKVNRNDILFAMIGSIGNPVLVSTDTEFSIKNMALFKNISSIIDMRYLYWFLFISQDTMKKQASGGVQSFVSLKFLRELLFPLPPLAEQKRIVEKIEELLPLCEKLK